MQMGKQVKDSPTDIQDPNCSTSCTRSPDSMSGGSHVRLDKWLWATRVYKTRSDAAEACRGSAIRLNDTLAKPSAKVRVGDIIIARTKVLNRTLYVVGLTEKRVGASRLSDYFEDRTPDFEYEAAREKQSHAKLFGSKGAGRPTKKDRRAIERLNRAIEDI